MYTFTHSCIYTPAYIHTHTFTHTHTFIYTHIHTQVEAIINLKLRISCNFQAGSYWTLDVSFSPLKIAFFNLSSFMHQQKTLPWFTSWDNLKNRGHFSRFQSGLESCVLSSILSFIEFCGLFLKLEHDAHFDSLDFTTTEKWQLELWAPESCMGLCNSYKHYRSSGAYELLPFKLKSPMT